MCVYVSVCVCVCVCVFSSKDCLARNHIDKESPFSVIKYALIWHQKVTVPPILNLFHTHKMLGTESTFTTQNSVSCQQICHLCNPKVHYRVYDSPPLHSTHQK